MTRRALITRWSRETLGLQQMREVLGIKVFLLHPRFTGTVVGKSNGTRSQEEEAKGRGAKGHNHNLMIGVFASSSPSTSFDQTSERFQGVRFYIGMSQEKNKPVG